jgi:hypothetical protein
VIEAPKVDPRTREEVMAQARRLLARSVAGWPAQPSNRAADALIGVFGRLCETVIDRLNNAPRKHLLAFLDMLGASPMPAQAARVPLTFHLAAQHTGHVTVPALTQVAATLEKGEQQPVLFETEREMVVTSAELVAVTVKEGSADRFDDHGAIREQPAPHGVSMFHGTQLIEHHWYIDLPLATPPPIIQKLGIGIELDKPIQPSAPNWLQWELWNGTPGFAIPLRSASDSTHELTTSGEITFDAVPGIPQTDIRGRKGYWLRCRTIAPLTDPARMPSIRNVAVRVESARQKLPVDAASTNGAVLDPTKDFFPFGQHPSFGDTFYLSNIEAFSKSGATVTLHIVLTNPASGGSQLPIPPVSARGVRLRWEVWDGISWITAGICEFGRENRDDAAGFSDTTKALTESGEVTFRLPPSTASLKFAGKQGFWIRVRLIGGDYNRPEVRDAATVPKLPLPSPPAIAAISVDYNLQVTALPVAMLTYNDFTYREVMAQAGSFQPFQTETEQVSHCYFGFKTQNKFSDRSMSIYLGVANPADRKTMLDMSAPAQAIPVWEYWDGLAWTKWTVIDDTDAFRRSGIIRFLAPRDFPVRSAFGKDACWIRVRVLATGNYDPRLRLVVLNTTMASHTITLKDELLGSSNGTPGQRFATTKSPVLAGQQLEVLEPAMPSPEARRLIREEEGDDAIRPVTAGDPRGPGVWVRWHEVPNFNGSGPRDRHYVIDRAAGRVDFGDGINGRIPPAGSKNIVMARYQTGGGASGNRKIHTIEQMKTAIPYVDKVTNWEPAAGGADAEPIDKLIEHAPRQLRHGYRAVTAQDFEDLAMLASPGVARAHAVPLYDLVQDPDATAPRPGVVSLIIAPVVNPSTPFERRPTPSMELIRRVRDYLDEHRLTEADLVIVGPEYVAIKVEVEVAVFDVDKASEVELAVSRALSRYLHPATGRWDGQGWHFGQEPARSDLYALIEDVPGVDHVRELKVTRVEDRPGAYKTGYFLICAAEPQVTATLEK